jgi:hypothetical protein
VGTRRFFPRARTNRKRGVLVFVFRGTAAAPVVADVGTRICRDLNLHMSAMAVCLRYYPKPLVIWRKLEKH